MDKRSNQIFYHTIC